MSGPWRLSSRHLYDLCGKERGVHWRKGCEVEGISATLRGSSDSRPGAFTPSVLTSQAGATTNLMHPPLCSGIFVFLRKFLPRENAKNTKKKCSFSAIFAFFCGYHLWLRLCRAEKCAVSMDSGTIPETSFQNARIRKAGLVARLRRKGVRFDYCRTRKNFVPATVSL